MNKNIAVVSSILLCTILICQPFSATAKEQQPGLLLADDRGNILFSQNPDTPFTPASILKMFTSLAAVDAFGTDHRFKTLFAYDKISKNLYIKGFGDPLFISEVIRDLTDQIRLKTKARVINHIILDSSFFNSDITIPGTGTSSNPYDATTGALCANFNTISFKWDPGLKKFISPEPQTPLLPDFLGDIKRSGQKQGRILLSSEQRQAYPGLLIQYFLAKRGIPVNGSVKQGRFDNALSPIFAFESPFTLEQILQKLLKYSNNFMANQLMLAMGAKKKGGPATLEKGVLTMEAFGREKLGLTRFAIAEGSGLSRENKISPDQMLKVLMQFMPLHPLLTQEKNEYYKTGTLSDVRCRAGFIRGNDNRLYPFVIMINEKEKGYAKIRQELLKKVFRISTIP
ncbi:MAG: D-alanyl-D-alanine carboxypeptidase [Proteobacteria bacterium]|nr:D-alanyl-D-alanine carboxypeptidase [Pseudomonadota bacterium]